MQEPKKPARLAPPAIKQIVFWQSLFAVVITTVIWQWNKTAALAIFYGAAIFVIPNSYFVWHSFRYIGAAQTKLIARSIYKGQAAKFVLTIVMFGTLFKLVNPASVWLVFVSYGLNALFHFLATARALNKASTF